jgi:competence ComEA-like helix-hairpin-helix protein
MKVSKDEQRALAFVAFLILLAAGARIVQRPPAAYTDLQALELGAFEATARASMEAASRRSRPLEAGERIDPNTADADELQRLPGVGPAVAGRIVTDRAANGPYRSLGELGRVQGIGERTLERLAPHLEFGAASSWGGVAGEAAAANGVAPRPPPVLGGPAAAAGSSGRSGADGPVDVNAASLTELQRLPGIGPAIAARIVAYRDSAGPFRSPAELERVSGIGPATVARITPYLLLAP